MRESEYVLPWILNIFNLADVKIQHKLMRIYEIPCTVTIQLPDMSGIQMVKSSLIAEWSAIQMGSE